ncbi:PepSY domain-containing protein [Sphingobacterium thalpophilum]|uniref:NADPH--hemoprotein reductase n=1 Tax=Sphingobacterium thalpophilum TaxID=259 RepID=A0A4U9W7C9_9SPHI|nr:PepSY domain-containing protein [Sphingobacterium thalpophilum]VTR54775.1 Sulfite reductase [NADPH] flavoprotein alpha-component [Sphingobacterium thalpophilum]
MLVSVWRYAHLALAIVSSVFLLLLAVTGVILAVDAVNEQRSSYRAENIDSLDLSQTLPNLRKIYPEIVELTIDYGQFVSIDAVDTKGSSVKGYIDPKTGKFLGEKDNKSQFVQWVTALHRSLFLKVTGRVIIGVVSFLLFLITVSGLVLIVKRQQGVRNFFAKINRDFFSQYFHVVSGRLFLIPVFILALTGTYLFMVRIGLLDKTNQTVEYQVKTEQAERDIANFSIFKRTKLSDVVKVEFPFMEDDPEEYYVLKLKDRELTINQLNGSIHKEVTYPFTALAEQVSLDLHTGQTNRIWAIILGLASLNILFFIYTGFVITFKRTRIKIKNCYSTGEAEIIILVGTENGSTSFFANQIHKQLLADGQKSLLLGMNQYQTFPRAKHIIVFTSTYGLGTAPSNASQFGKKIWTYSQQAVNFSVLGFGSKAYPDFCAYAHEIDILLAQQSWANRLIPLHTVNDKNVDELISWIHHWSEKTGIAIVSTPAIYTPKVAGLKRFRVIEKSVLSANNSTFTVLLKPQDRVQIQSGDLLAIYPAKDQRERFYSIGYKNGMVQLVVKLFPDGFGSSFLYQLQQHQLLEARVLVNPRFHFPKSAPAVALIANGTGIAPFLGMIAENQAKTPVRLYAGFRYDNATTAHYRQFAEEQKHLGQLQQLRLAFSREQPAQYVMDLIREEGVYFVNLLEHNGCVMLCGALQMQHDVEAVLNEILLKSSGKTLEYYKRIGQVLTDCY